jgi:hypothetical protein
LYCFRGSYPLFFLLNIMMRSSLACLRKKSYIKETEI